MKILYHPYTKYISLFYSVRRIRLNYAGYCVRVRRSTDNALLDVGFVGDIIDIVAIQDFIGSATGYIQIWYDQSGNNNNLEQTNYTNQPFIIENGVVKYEKDIPTIYWSGSQYMVSISNINCGTQISVIILSKLYILNSAWERLISGYPDCYFYIGGSISGANINIHSGNGTNWNEVYGTDIPISFWNNYVYATVTYGKTLLNNITVYANQKTISIATSRMEGYNNKVVVGGMFIYNNNIVLTECWKGSISEIQILNNYIEEKNILNMVKKSNYIFKVYSQPSPKPNTAQDFIDITGIVDSAIISAIEELCSDLINNGLWDKMVAIYPFVGGTEYTHKFNLIDPQDTDGAYRLSFNGGITHDSNGATPNGINGYAETHLLPSSLGVTSDYHISYYSRTIGASSGAVIEMGGNDRHEFMIRYTGDKFYATLGGDSFPSVSNTTTHGYFIASKYISGKISAYRNNTRLMDGEVCNDGVGGDRTMILFGCNYGATIPNRPSSKNCAFVTIGYGLNDYESVILNDYVQKFQTALNRNV